MGVAGTGLADMGDARGRGGVLDTAGTGAGAGGGEESGCADARAMGVGEALVGGEAFAPNMTALMSVKERRRFISRTRQEFLR
jgi:hypothetical protein